MSNIQRSNEYIDVQDCQYQSNIGKSMLNDVFSLFIDKKFQRGMGESGEEQFKGKS